MPSGGKRAGAGRPRKPLTARIDEGVDAVSHRKPKVLDFPPDNQNNQKTAENGRENQLSRPENQNKSNFEPPPLPTFLDMASKEGDESLPSASDIYRQTLDWITGAGCEKFVPPQLIEDFAFTRRSYLEVEYMNKKLGRVLQGGKPSPYVRAALDYMKQATALYREIWAIVAQNSTKDFTGNGGNAFLAMLTNRGF